MNKTFVMITALILLLLLSGKGKKFLKMKTATPKLPTPPLENNYTEQDAEKAIQKVKQIYGDAIARKVEKIFRFETGHFTSEQYRRTGTAGMVKGNWSNLPNLPTVSGIGTVNKAGEESSKTVYYVWNPIDFALYLAQFLTKYNGNEGRWSSVNKAGQERYIASLKDVKTKYA